MMSLVPRTGLQLAVPGPVFVAVVVLSLGLPSSSNLRPGWQIPGCPAWASDLTHLCLQPQAFLFHLFLAQPWGGTSLPRS